jgi:hypothetical protein
LPFFDCRIRLSGLITRKAIETHILDLAYAHCQHWFHRVSPARNSWVFLEVESEAPPEEFTFDFSKAFAAQLCLGWYDPTLPVNDNNSDHPTYPSGFRALLWETDGIDAGNDTGISRMVWARPFPMQDVPIPAFLQTRSGRDDISDGE